MHLVTYVTHKNKRDILPDAYELAENEGDSSYHGNMTFHDTVIYENEDAATEAINKFNNGYYSDHAVQYYESVEQEPSKKLQSLIDKHQTLILKKQEYDDNNYILNRASQFIGCPNCKSKLSRDYIEPNPYYKNKCPLCKSELRSKTVLNRLTNYDVKIKELSDQIEKQTKKEAKRGDVKWMAKIEIHC